MNYSLEFTDADDSRLKDAYGEQIDSVSPLLIPSVGDFVIHDQHLLSIVGRQFTYDGDDCYVQCFCRKTNESNIRSHLKETQNS